MPKKFTPEIKARAVRTVRQHLAEYGSVTKTSAMLGQQLDISANTLPLGRAGRHRRRPARRRPNDDAGGARGAQGGDPAAARDQRDLAQGLNFLRRGTRPPQPLIMAFVDALVAVGLAVESICAVLRGPGCQVAARTYRSWKQDGRRIAARTYPAGSRTAGGSRTAPSVTRS